MGNDYAIKGDELGVSKQFVKERREHIHHLLNLVQTYVDELLEHVEKGWWITGSNMAFSSLDFHSKSVIEEIGRNYSIKRSEKCPYCKEKFVGILAYDRCSAHKYEKHPEEMKLEMQKGCLLVTGMIALWTGNMQTDSSKWLYEKTGSANAKKVLALSKRGADIPVELMKAYNKDHDDYMDSIDPKRKWHKPSDCSYLDNCGEKVVGNRTIVKEIAKAFLKLGKGKEEDHEQEKN